MVDSHFLQQFGEVKEQVCFSSLTTFKVGGEVAYVVYPRDLFALQGLLHALEERAVKYKILGNGSNVLASDDSFDGVVIKMTQGLSDVYYHEGYVVAQAGVSLIALAYDCAKRNRSCLEWAGGIPGTVGGAVFMNAGSYQSSMSDVIESVYVYRNKTFEWVSLEACGFSYRESVFRHQPWIICAVKIKTIEQDSFELIEKMKDRQARRLKSQPLDVASAGSCFRNPEDRFAWAIIDECGLRGYRVGQAEVSLKHSNFVVNHGGANASQVNQVIEKVQQVAREKMEVELCLEIEKFNWK